LSIEYLKNIKIINNSIQSNIIFKTHLILNTYPENGSIDYENLYLGGDNFVRGFNPNPFSNAAAAINKLKFNNMIFQSIQFEAPFTSNQYIQSKILLFNDFSIGSNNYKHFTSNNKIKGYGMGIAIIMQNNIRFDICIGLNKYGTAELHFFKNATF
jgi:outer membrane protein assembly factor BamA